MLVKVIVSFQTKNNETVMVDTGGKVVQTKIKDNHNIAKYHIIPTLKSRGISKSINLILLIHITSYRRISLFSTKYKN